MLEQEWSTVSRRKISIQKKEGENDTDGEFCRVQMGDFETVKPQMFRQGVRAIAATREKDMELLGGCFRFALACSAEDVLGCVALSGAGIVGISRGCAA